MHDAFIPPWHVWPLGHSSSEPPGQCVSRLQVACAIAQEIPCRGKMKHICKATGAMQTGCAPKAISQTSSVPPLITHTVPSVAGVIVLHGRKGARSCRRRGYWSLRRNQIVRVVAPRVAVAALSTGTVGVLSIWTPVIPNRVFEQFRSPIIVASFVMNQTVCCMF